jgi:type VI secretion system protein ImpL
VDNGLTIAMIVGLLLIALGVLLIALRAGVDQEADKASTRRALLDIGRLRASFDEAINTIERNIADRSKRYDIPWVVLLHDGDETVRPAIERCGLSNVLAGESLIPSQTGLHWHLFDRGVVIELNAEQLDDAIASDTQEKRWEAFVAMCGKYRPQRPLDSVVIAVPAAMLADRSPQGREHLRARADAASRRIWIAQNRYAMRFAVYVVVTGCEQLPGFADFAQALPPSMQDGMLGWSSPHQPSTLFQAGWVDEAFDQVEQNLIDSSAELFASQTTLRSATEVFLLPSQIAALRTGARDYLDALMRPNAFHEPFFLRGIYLSGTTERPMFLRGVMESKVFAEFGLSRAAHSQKLARPLMSRIGRWLAVGIPLAYAFGIIITTIQLQRVLPVLAEGLEGLKRDIEYRAQASNTGERIEFEWYRKTALQLMIGLEELQSRRLNRTTPLYDTSFINPFMPGSWPMFDDVRERARQRIASEFSDLGVRTLQQAVYRRTAELTHAPLNPITYHLTGGSNDCDGPQLLSTSPMTGTVATVALERMNEFVTLQRYASDVTRLETNVSSLLHLGTPHKNSQASLRMLVLDMLGAELPGDLEASVTLFRNAAAKEVVLVDHAAVSSAVSCGFTRAALALNQQLFTDNALLRNEERVINARNAVLNLFGGKDAPGSGEVILSYRRLRDALNEQRSLLATGYGAWLLHEELKLGPSYDKLMKQFADNDLISNPAIADIERRSKEDFFRARQRFVALFGSGTEMGISTESKQGSLQMSGERLALLAALDHLLAQPFMQPAVGDALETTPRNTLVQWNTDELARAIKLGEGHRKYLTEDLPKFPSSMQEAVNDLIDYQYALRLVDLIGHAYTRLDRGSAASDYAQASTASYEMTSQQVRKLILLLRELGQDGEANALQSILVNDASGRLKLLNDALQSAHPYQILDESDDGRSELRDRLVLFAQSDDAADYLRNQMSVLQTLSAQVQLLRSALPADSRTNGDLTRWQSIAREIELHTAKDPKSSALKLERFVNELTRELDAPTCLTVLRAHEPPKRTNNYFTERHAELHRAISRRCLALDRRSFVEQWRTFAADFNKLLKGRRPFIGQRSMLRGNEFNAIAAADQSDVSMLLQRLPNVSADVFARNNVPEGSAIPIRDFAAQAVQVRQLMSSLFPNDPAAPAGLDVMVKFRANANGEQDGNKIIDWSITIGDQTLGLRDAPRALRWRVGEPVRISLRFANDVPIVPRADPENPYLEVSRKNAVFRFEGPWALLDMLQLMRANEVSDTRNSLIKLEVPIQSDERDPTSRARPVRVFVGMTLSEPGKTTALPWPAQFPERAPTLER